MTATATETRPSSPSGGGGLDGFFLQTWEYYRRKLAWAEARNPPGAQGYFRMA